MYNMGIYIYIYIYICIIYIYIYIYSQVTPPPTPQLLIFCFFFHPGYLYSNPLPPIINFQSFLLIFLSVNNHFHHGLS